MTKSRLLKFLVTLLLGFTVLLASSVIAEAHDSLKFGAMGPAVVELQQDLQAIGYTVKADGTFGLRTLRAVNHFQRANRLPVVRAAGPLTMAALNGATATQPAVRGTQVQVTPPPPPPLPATTSGPCREWAGELIAQSPGWDVNHMQNIMYRESRCQPGARNPSGATGLLQIMPMWVKYLGHCGVYSTSDLTDPVKNICGARHIYVTQGMNAWSQTR